jgi:small subunit ribosomal protein S5
MDDKELQVNATPAADAPSEAAAAASSPDADAAAAPAATVVSARGDARTFNIRRGRGGMGGRGGGGRGRMGGRGRPREGAEQSDYEEKNLEVARVTRVTKGGKRMRFRTLAVIGNRKGRVGFGIGKGVDVAGATAKAQAQARKNLITVPMVHDTIPHPVNAKFSAASVLIKPAPKGSGIKAGGAVRQVLELAGVPNAVSKILGSANKINNVKATFAALKKLKAPPKAVVTHEQEEKQA